MKRRGAGQPSCHACRPVVTLIGLALAATCCGGVPPPAVPAPPADIVVLTVDPESGVLGQATVQAQGQTVDLASDLSATRVTTGQPPTAPTTMTSDEFQRRFGAAMSARPPQPLQFLLYFTTGGDTLTTESQAELTRTVEAIRTRPSPDVTVIGHTDTTGDAAANAALGLRRAALIRDQLMSAGVPASQIDATSHGEADLLVATPDGVADVRNRRVEIAVR